MIDSHAPKKTKIVAEREARPWMNTEIHQAKKQRRKCEKVWRKSKLTVHKEIYIEERQKVKSLISASKTKYFNEKIKDCEGNQKSLFTIVDKLLHRKQPSSLPKYTSLADLATDFSEFFVGKIRKIRDDLEEMENTTSPLTCPSVPALMSESETIMDTFEPATENEILKIIKGSSKASCTLDPIPTRFLVDHLLPDLLPIITEIVNASLSSGEFPIPLKTALVKPLLKNTTLSPENFKNFRPISNLPFISKIIERVAAKRLSSHMTSNGLHDKMQSAYKPYHSTESSLLRVHNDILTAIDQKSGVLLALIDLSAAFDTVDHRILLCFLKETLGIRGTALKWFETYLTGRLQCVLILEVMSDLAEILFGVPQGSVMGPFLFCVYTLPIGAIIKAHGLNYAIYADDTQVYLRFDVNDPQTALEKMNACLLDIRTWMITKKLKINDDKTEFVTIGSPNMHSKLQCHDLSLAVGNSNISPAYSAKNLGVLFDSTLTMDGQVTKICQSAGYHLRNIGSIRNLLSDSACTQLVHSLISSRLDYCNSLLTGIPDFQIQRIQKIQNNAARVVCKIKKFDHISPTLQELHWLPVKERIKFKILLLTFKCLHGMAPAYLSELLTDYTPSRSLRSSSKQLLNIPKINLKSYGGRSFSYVAPVEWNELPLHIKSCNTVDNFKKQLKTYLFKQAFN